MTKHELLETFKMALPVMDYAETVEISRVLLKVINKATLNGSLVLTEDESNK